MTYEDKYNLVLGQLETLLDLDTHGEEDLREGVAAIVKDHASPEIAKHFEKYSAEHEFVRG